MKSVACAVFKEKCLHFLDHVGPDGLVVTKHGKPVAKLMPVETNPSQMIGSLKKKIKILSKIKKTGMKWHVES